MKRLKVLIFVLGTMWHGMFAASRSYPDLEQPHLTYIFINAITNTVNQYILSEHDDFIVFVKNQHNPDYFKEDSKKYDKFITRVDVVLRDDTGNLYVKSFSYFMGESLHREISEIANNQWSNFFTHGKYEFKNVFESQKSLMPFFDYPRYHYDGYYAMAVYHSKRMTNYQSFSTLGSPGGKNYILNMYNRPFDEWCENLNKADSQLLRSLRFLLFDYMFHFMYI